MLIRRMMITIATSRLLVKWKQEMCRKEWIWLLRREERLSLNLQRTWLAKTRFSWVWVMYHTLSVIWLTERRVGRLIWLRTWRVWTLLMRGMMLSRLPLRICRAAGRWLTRRWFILLRLLARTARQRLLARNLSSPWRMAHSLRLEPTLAVAVLLRKAWRVSSTQFWQLSMMRK